MSLPGTETGDTGSWPQGWARSYPGKERLSEKRESLSDGQDAHPRMLAKEGGRGLAGTSAERSRLITTFVKLRSDWSVES